MSWTADGVESELAKRGLSYEIKDLEHSRQFRLASGEVVNCFKTGTVNVQGKKTTLATELTEVLCEPRAASSSAVVPTEAAGTVLKRVFVVYGHNEDEKARLEAMLRRWGLEPIILDQEAAAGLTLIEKLERRANSECAVVLMTGDDVARSKAEPETSTRPRARQNVVLELGMFLGSIGRERVVILYEQGVEIPSDIRGVEYIGFVNRIDDKKLELAKALANLGAKIDLAKV